MVQINREAVSRRTGGLRQTLLGFLRVVCMSAVIPLLFMVRFSLKSKWLHNRASAVTGTVIADLSDAVLGSTSSSVLHADLAAVDEAFAFLRDLDLSDHHTLRNRFGSDVVELYHCPDLLLNDEGTYRNFTTWAYPLLNYTMAALQEDLIQVVAFGAADAKTMTTLQHQQQVRLEVQQEFALQLLEQYASDELLCDYSLYRPTVYEHESVGLLLQELSNRIFLDNEQHPEQHAAGEKITRIRLVFVIMAFRDIEQLTALIDAIVLPYHYIVIHLERRCSEEYANQVQQLSDSFPNVVVLQFGTVTYRTDSVSRINLQIMRWLTLELELTYDYMLLLDGAAFPLASPDELMQTLAGTDSDVWLGELLHKGQAVDSSADHLLRHKRLWTTRGYLPKLDKRLPLYSSRTVISDKIKSSMTRKSTSGNQGIYSHHVAHQLLASDTVMEIFALSKYGCCCCLEERNWIAALTAIGYQHRALEYTSMFQLWGGKEECMGSMSNAVLLRNASLCYRTEDPEREDMTSMYFYGNDLWMNLQDAKERGFLFARKFASDSAESLQLMDDILGDLWDL
jgi:hypothetical protein